MAEGTQQYAFLFENDEKDKARSMGVFRREYQVRKHTLFDYTNQHDIPIAYEKLLMLADELIEIQTEEYEFFKF